jgi:integrase
VFRFTGLQFNPHLFRHLAAKLFLEQRPGQYEVVREVLGHASMRTTTGSYTGGEARAAGDHFAEVVLGLRSKGTSTKAAARSPE